MAKHKLSLDALEEEINRLRQQLEEHEAVKNKFADLFHQRGRVIALRDRLAKLELPDTIEDHDTLRDSIGEAREAIGAAWRAMSPGNNNNHHAAATRQRRASSDPSVLRSKLDFHFRRQAKLNAGLVDAEGRPKKRLSGEEQVLFDKALKKLKQSGWYPPELVRANRRRDASS